MLNKRVGEWPIVILSFWGGVAGGICQGDLLLSFFPCLKGTLEESSQLHKQQLGLSHAWALG